MIRKNIIKIKDPQLQKVRYNLRMLIIKAAFVKTNRLREEWKRVYYKEHDSERAQQINKRIDTITRALRESICMCKVCGTAKKDMVLSPDLKTWFCVDCYELNRVYHKKTKYGKSFPYIFCN